MWSAAQRNEVHNLFCKNLWSDGIDFLRTHSRSVTKPVLPYIANQPRWIRDASAYNVEAVTRPTT
jgi:hypothetical protein